MNPRLILAAWLTFLTLVAGGRPSAAQELIEADTFLNVRIAGALHRLEAYVARPRAGQGRLPVALITHGKAASGGRMADLRAKSYAMHARDFARRGYLAVVVIRRGFGRSDGPEAALISCASPGFEGRLAADADDLQAALAAIAERSDADGDRVVAIGASVGGLAVLALAARNPPGLRGVVNVSGGLRFESCEWRDRLVRAVADAGRRSKIKTLWIYAENDQSFAPDIADRMHEAFLTAGGDVRRFRAPAVGKDGHTMFNTLLGRRIWWKETDAFLRDLILPTWRQQDVSAVIKRLGFEEGQRNFVERYLFSPGEKVMAKSRVSSRGHFQFGNADIGTARKRALQACETLPPGQDCKIVLENFQYAGSESGAILPGAPAE